MNTDLHFTCFVAAPDSKARKAAVEQQDKITVGDAGTSEGSSTGVVSTSGAEPQGSGDVVQTASPSPDKSLSATEANPVEGQLKGMRLIELDGRRPLPIDYGPCTDVLDVRAFFFIYFVEARLLTDR
jgi:ubiquitin carboxyl-terminal hydrolase L3